MELSDTQRSHLQQIRSKLDAFDFGRRNVHTLEGLEMDARDVMDEGRGGRWFIPDQHLRLLHLQRSKKAGSFETDFDKAVARLRDALDHLLRPGSSN